MGPGELIEQAAVELLDAQGLDGVTVRTVAARAHYHRSTVMYHIGSVAQLRQAMWRSIASSVVSQLFPVDVEPGTDAWAERAAAILVEEWQQRPNRMHFFSSYAHVYSAPEVLDGGLVESLFPHCTPALAGPAADYALGLLAAVTRLVRDLPDATRAAAALGALVRAMRADLGVGFRSR